MTNTVFFLFKLLIAFIPFILFALVNAKANLKQEKRSRQFLMPVLALIYCIVFLVLANKLQGVISTLTTLLSFGIQKLGSFLSQYTDFGNVITQWGDKLENAVLSHAALIFLVVFNTLLLIVHIILKRIIITILSGIFKPGNALYEMAVSPFYSDSGENNIWVVREEWSKTRTYFRAFYVAGIIISIIAMMASVVLYQRGLLTSMFLPAFGVIIIGEVYFFLNGKTSREVLAEKSGERDQNRRIYDYASFRSKLEELFGDKLVAQDTANSTEFADKEGSDQVLNDIEKLDSKYAEFYSIYMRNYAAKGNKPDTDYITSGLELLQGKSILFNNPFYYDLIPYIFFAMDRTILRKKKALIVLGRHGTEEDMAQWCREGLAAISGIMNLWRIGVLKEKSDELDIGIITRSDVHNKEVHEANCDFLKEVEFVVLAEPSKLVSTAQIGLNSLVRAIRSRQDKKVTWCSMDKNCDGLLDALSHILMTSLTEVSPTSHRENRSTYMCWAPDTEYTQHRIVPNIARYLGFGTELSFTALKNQISHTVWYGGSAFPVVDMHWIVKQYYFELLKYANLPLNQENIERYFEVSHNTWNEKRREANYITVEDEDYNVFEVKRTFSTRAVKESFVNVITSNYLLRDYMTSNNNIFDADPKAIPYVVADYARTRRNVALRLCLRMSTGYVTAHDITTELRLIDQDKGEPLDGLWSLICTSCAPVKTIGKKGEVLFNCILRGKDRTFGKEVFEHKRQYSIERGKVEDTYRIIEKDFILAVVDDLQSAGYVAEDEAGKMEYLGTELKGHVFQKYLPGQFFTLNGKYYEMRSLMNDGRIIIRRAADHINGRCQYRQVRDYLIKGAVNSTDMGAVRNIGGMKVIHQFADITAKTLAYWKLSDYSDFETGQKITVNGIPERNYRNKELLKIDLTSAFEGFTPKICVTVTMLINEILRSMFAENQAYITAVTTAGADLPLNASVTLEEGNAEENVIYIIEDSQLDMGLLVAFERNLDRILDIMCDYLEWHTETMEKSMNPPKKAEKQPVVLPEKPEGEEEAQKKKCFLARLFGRKNKPKKEKKKKGKDKQKPESVPEPESEAAVQPETLTEPETVNQPEAPADQPAATNEPEEPADREPADQPEYSIDPEVKTEEADDISSNDFVEAEGEDEQRLPEAPEEDKGVNGTNE